MFELEQDTLMRCLAAIVLARQAQLGDYQVMERVEWVQRLIRQVFADPLDADALSHKFARHGEDRLDMDVWCAHAKIDSDFFGRHPRWQEICAEVAAELPGFGERSRDARF